MTVMSLYCTELYLNRDYKKFWYDVVLYKYLVCVLCGCYLHWTMMTAFFKNWIHVTGYRGLIWRIYVLVNIPFAIWEIELCTYYRRLIGRIHLLDLYISCDLSATFSIWRVKTRGTLTFCEPKQERKLELTEALPNNSKDNTVLFSKY